MKPRHGAALALVGWYLLIAPTFRKPQTDSFTVDLSAPLSAWDLVSNYYSNARATMLARYTDGQGRPLRQRELCDRHANWLKANRPNVHDLRDAPDAGQVKLESEFALVI